jgi:hypothetical protein
MRFRSLRAGELDRVEEVLAIATADADAPADRAGQPGRLGRGSIVFLILSILCVAFLATGESWAVMGIAFGLLIFPIFIVVAIRDLLAPNPRGRATSEQAVACYLKSVRRERYKAAWACLSEQARNNDVPLPTKPNEPVSPQTTTLRDSTSVKTYWRSLCGKPGSFDTSRRRIAALKIGPAQGSGPVRRHVVGFRVAFFDFEFPLVTFKHRSQWWLLTGEFASEIDRDLPISDD